MDIKFLSQLSQTELNNKKVLVRIDANVPLGDNGVVDENEAFRIQKTLPTLKLLQNAGAKTILIAHHETDGLHSLKPIADYLEQLGFICHFVPETLGKTVEQKLQQLKGGEFLLLENLRFHEEEKVNDTGFAKTLATYADIYVNDAFSVSHREHASIIGIPRYIPGYIGLQYEQELKHLNTLRKSNEGLLVIVGGAKFKTKLDLIKDFLQKNIPVFVGGALAHSLYKARGLNIGQSLFDENAHIDDIKDHPQLFTPEWVVVQNNNTTQEKPITEIDDSDSIVDIGLQSFTKLNREITSASQILWNGPLGWYEGGFSKGSLELAQTLSQSQAFTVVGGGDTITVLQDSNTLDGFDFVSTGGGALLDQLVNGKLPGTQALER